jgi:hypothetical protein
MSSVYRETISDARLKAVSEHVRKWLWPADEKPAADQGHEGTIETAGGRVE